MSTDEINRAIAEHLGWRLIQCRDDGFGRAASERWRDPDGDIGPCPPIYTHDLNAMHEAEKVLTPLEFEVYRWILWGLCKQPQVTEWSRSYLSAVASQRAEAFLKAIGKWRDS